VQTYAKTNSCGYAILRYGHIYGPGEEAYRKLIPEIIRGLLKGETPVLHGDGSAERDFLFVDDAIEATMRAAVSSQKEIGPLNVVRGSTVTVKAVVEMVSRITGYTGEISYRTDKPSGRSFRFDNKRLRETLGDWDVVALADGLAREIRYFKALHSDCGDVRQCVSPGAPR
jgi:nucleoside-diphosphate-sugar epimerase